MESRYLNGWGFVNALLAFWLILAGFFVEINGIAAAEAKPIKILALGTSLTQGYNLPPGTDYCSLLQAALRAKGHDVTFINAGVSGDTSAGGLARLEWAMSDPADAAIVELGANDALRGLDVTETRKNISAVVANLKRRGVVVLLAGMKSPRNLGPEYSKAFDAIYPQVAAEQKVLLYPFFLEGVAANLKLNQADGIHPNEAGSKVIVRGILPYVEKLIGQVQTKSAPAAKP
jgi:acyl-CoA thioesterase I